MDDQIKYGPEKRKSWSSFIWSLFPFNCRKFLQESTRIPIAISLYKDGELSSKDGDLTYAGQIMANIPVDLKLAKLILFGHIFGKLREAIIIAASLSVRDLYLKNYRSNFEFYKY